MNSHIRITVLLITLLSVCLIIGNTEARPKFPKVFEANYEKEYAATQINSKSCTVCHDKTNAREYPLNNYGEALGESLKVTDEEEIRSALKYTESKPSAIEGKTFGDLIHEGRLPASR